MKKRIHVVVALALLAMALALPGTAVAARSPQPVPRFVSAAGEWSWTGGEFITDELVDGRQYFHGHEDGTWAGTFEGTAYEPYFGVIFPGGRLWAVIMINFTGTVDGVSGGALIKLIVNAGTDPAENMGGRWKILRGTGGLKGLHGAGTWVFTHNSDDGLTGYADYSGVYSLP